MDERDLYMRHIRRGVEYFFEMFEEGNAGDTRMIGLLKPSRSIGNTDTRNFIFSLLAAPGASISGAAVSVNRWLIDYGWAPEFAGEIENELRALCAPLDREKKNITDREEKISRAFLRLVRYLRELAEEDPSHGTARAHSRIFDYFIPKDWIPRGASRRIACPDQKRHKEHVVPCAYMRQHCLQQIRDGKPLDQVAAFARRCLAIVDITIEESERLDCSPPKGLGLKDTMPANWDPESGNIYVRLMAADIEFVMHVPS